MSQKIKNYISVIFTIFALTTPLLLPLTSSADCTDSIQQSVNNGVSEATGQSQNCGSTNVQSGIKSIAVEIVNILSIVVGIVAVIMIIYGGFRYITSGGESGNVQSAKNTLLFAIVGLVIVALAQVIVRWVIGTSSNISTPAGFIHFL